MALHVYAVLYSGSTLYFGIKSPINPYNPTGGVASRLYCAGMPNFFGGTVEGSASVAETLCNEVADESQGLFTANPKKLEAYISQLPEKMVIKREDRSNIYMFYPIPVGAVFKVHNTLQSKASIAVKTYPLCYVDERGDVQEPAGTFSKSHGSPKALEFKHLVELKTIPALALSINSRSLVEILIERGCCEEMDPKRTDGLTSLQEYYTSFTAEILDRAIRAFGKAVPPSSDTAKKE